MPIRYLRCLFDPASVALIGASERPGSLGAALTRNLLDGGFKGELFLVNRRHRRVREMSAYPHPADLPSAQEALLRLYLLSGLFLIERPNSPVVKRAREGAFGGKAGCLDNIPCPPDRPRRLAAIRSSELALCSIISHPRLQSRAIPRNTVMKM